MLKRLAIQNLALIDTLEIEFAPQLNLITGETGAGKSILVDALSFVLGKRASVSLLREGEERCVVQAVFELMDSNIDPWNLLLEEKGLPRSEGELWFKRELTDRGRGRCWINGEATPLSTLAQMAGRLVDFHGQHDHQALTHAEEHLALLDRYGKLENEAAGLAELFSAWQKAGRELDSAGLSENERLRRLDLLKFQVCELEDANLRQGEWEKLKEDRDLAASAEKRAILAATVREAFSGDGGGLEKVEEAARAWLNLAALDPSLDDSVLRLKEALIEIKDVAEQAVDYTTRIEHDPVLLEKIENRLAQLENLSRKYGPDEAAMILYLETVSKEKENLENHEESAEALKKAAQVSEEKYRTAALVLAKKRKIAGSELSKEVTGELKKLGMPKAVFSVEARLRAEADAGSSGLEEIEFMLAANPGQGARSLAKTASGGELSRVMLALKTAFVEVDPVDTLIFDEIDSGVSGAVAQEVGERLSGLARLRQVFCITHLPQIASRPAHHLQVSKRIESGKTFTSVRVLDENARVEVVATLLDGKAPTESGLNHARQLLTGAT